MRFKKILNDGILHPQKPNVVVSATRLRTAAARASNPNHYRKRIGPPSASYFSFSTASSSAAAPLSSNSSEEGEVRSYLTLENMCPFKPSKEESAQIDKEDGFIDTANLVQRYDLTMHYYDLHIVYSESYRVPVLYFRAYTNTGSPLCLDDIEKDLPITYANELSHSKWTFITHEEHPYLNRPWYKLHPCGTSEWMKLLYLGDSSLEDGYRVGTELYLVSWLSVVGPMVGLKIPIEARKQLIEEVEGFKSSSMPELV